MTVSAAQPLTAAGIRIRDAASALFYQRGITAVGVDLIAETAGTTKKTLYDRFGSKEGLVVAYLQRRCDVWQDYVRDWLDASPTTGADRVLEVLRALEAWMRDNDRGCAFGNAYAELAGTGHSGLAVITVEKQWISGLYTELVRQAGLLDADRLGRQLALVHEGAIVGQTAGGNPQAIDDALAAASLLLTAAGPDPQPIDS